MGSFCLANEGIILRGGVTLKYLAVEEGYLPIAKV